MFSSINQNIKKFIRTNPNTEIVSDIINYFLDNEYISFTYQDYKWDFCKYFEDSSYHHCIISIKTNIDDKYSYIDIEKKYSTSLVKYIDLLNSFNNLLVDHINLIKITDNNNNIITYKKSQLKYDIISNLTLNKALLKKYSFFNIKSIISCKCIYTQCDMLPVYCSQQKIQNLYDLDKEIVQLLLSVAINVICKTNNHDYMDYCEVTPWILLYNCYAIYYNKINNTHYIETSHILNTIHDICLKYINQNSKNQNIIISRIISKLLNNNKDQFLDLQKKIFEDSNLNIDKYIAYNVQQYLVC